jgi:hypothetical protein
MGIQDSEDLEGLRVFYYLVQDLRVGFLDFSLTVLSVLYFLIDLSALQDQAYINLVLILGAMC